MWNIWVNALQQILSGLGYTIGVTLLALLFGFVIGLPLAIARFYGNRWVQQIALAYGVAMRGMPSLVVLMIVYYVLAGFVDLDPFLAGSFALGVCSSAYQAEIFRGAFQSVSSGQLMAARALGMTQLQAIFWIVLPQALRNAIAGWSNEAAIVVKDSSLVYAVGLPELLRRAQQVNGRLHMPLMIFAIVGVIYFLLTFVTNRLLDWVERKTSIPQMVEAR